MHRDEIGLITFPYIILASLLFPPIFAYKKTLCLFFVEFAVNLTTMTIARVSRGGRSEDLQSLEATTESERHDKDELENDADHKELVSTYGCEDYLLRWLPNIGNHDHVSHAATKPR